MVDMVADEMLDSIEAQVDAIMDEKDRRRRATYKEMPWEERILHDKLFADTVDSFRARVYSGRYTIEDLEMAVQAARAWLKEAPAPAEEEAPTKRHPDPAVERLQNELRNLEYRFTGSINYNQEAFRQDKSKITALQSTVDLQHENFYGALDSIRDEMREQFAKVNRRIDFHACNTSLVSSPDDISLHELITVVDQRCAMIEQSLGGMTEEATFEKIDALEAKSEEIQGVNLVGLYDFIKAVEARLPNDNVAASSTGLQSQIDRVHTLCCEQVEKYRELDNSIDEKIAEVEDNLQVDVLKRKFNILIDAMIHMIEPEVRKPITHTSAEADQRDTERIRRMLSLGELKELKELSGGK